MSRQTWGPEVHEDILLVLFQPVTITPADWGKVMTELQAKGYTFTDNALRSDFLKPAMSGKATRGWDASSNEALLLAIIEHVKPSKPIISAVTEKMTEWGYSYSFDAINQHVQKLRKGRNLSGIASANSTPKNTPAKGAARGKASAAKGRGKKNVSPEPDDKHDDDNDEDEDDDKKILKREKEEAAEPTTPVKRRKTVVKEQILSDEDEI